MMAAERFSARRGDGRRIGDLLADIATVAPEADRAITGLALDSRAVQPGRAFVAIAGSRGHGLDHADDALGRGAVAILVDADDPRAGDDLRQSAGCRGAAVIPVPDLARRVGTIAARFHDHPAAAFERVYAVTGTDGKTSVTHFLAAMRDRPEAGAAVLGTLGAGRPGEVVDTGLTTPDAVGLQAALAALAAQGVREVALEASSHGLAQYRLDGTRVDVAILTQLGRDHLDYHADEAAYAAAKARLFDWPGLAGVALNLDDAFGRRLLERVRPQVLRVGYSRSAAADAPDGTLRAIGLEGQPDGIRFRLGWRDVVRPVTLPLLGAFNVDNVLAAAAGLLAAGIAFEEVIAALDRVRPVPGRMELFRGSKGAGIVVDYAHNAGALAAALEALRFHTPGRIWCVFGAGGDRDRGKRPLMARTAAAGSDRVIITDDNPRSEDPAAIVTDILAGMPEHADFSIEHDRERAISQAWYEAGPGDMVLVAGKGHETTQTRAGGSIEWSDRAAAAALTAPAAGEDP